MWPGQHPRSKEILAGNQKIRLPRHLRNTKYRKIEQWNCIRPAIISIGAFNAIAVK